MIKTDCAGCDARDEMIEKLSKRIDELEREQRDETEALIMTAGALK